LFARLGCGRRAAAAVEADRLLRGGIVHQREEFAAEAGRIRRDDREHQRRRDRGIDRVAAAFEHAQCRIGAARMAARDHSVRAARDAHGAIDRQRSAACGRPGPIRKIPL
jgi:hypothetical protein